MAGKKFTGVKVNFGFVGTKGFMFLIVGASSVGSLGISFFGGFSSSELRSKFSDFIGFDEVFYNGN